MAEASELAAKRAAEKIRKSEERQRKEAEKAARLAQREASQAAKRAPLADAPSLAPSEIARHAYGNLAIRSEGVEGEGREWVGVGQLTPSLASRTVWLRARLASSRKQGKTLVFLTLRQSIHSVQAVVAGKGGGEELVGFASTLSRESVVDVLGEITLPASPIASCSQRDVEVTRRSSACGGEGGEGGGGRGGSGVAVEAACVLV